MRLLVDGSNLSLRFAADMSTGITTLYSPDGAPHHRIRAPPQPSFSHVTPGLTNPGETNVGALIAEMLQHPRLSDAEVVFDGAAFHGVHAGSSWPGGEGGTSITFTEKLHSADDAIMQLCEECEPVAPSCSLTSKKAVALCEGELAEGESRGAITATLVKSPSGRKERKRVEAHLRGVGLKHVGQTMSMPLLTEPQRYRSMNVVRGLARLGGDPIRFKHLPGPGAVVVTDDRGLARRCAVRQEPAAVLTSSQLASWLSQYLPDEEDFLEDEELQLIEEEV